MKKIFIAIAAIALSTAAKAQTTYSAGLEVGLPSGDASTISGLGIGGSVKANFALGKSENSSMTGSIGFINFTGKDVSILGVTVKYPSMTAIPVKFGYRYTTESGLFFEPQAGLTFFNNSAGTGFTWAGNVGYKVSDNLDLSARYESAGLSGGGTFNHIGFRLAYAFGGK